MSHKVCGTLFCVILLIFRNKEPGNPFGCYIISSSYDNYDDSSVPVVFKAKNGLYVVLYDLVGIAVSIKTKKIL